MKETAFALGLALLLTGLIAGSAQGASFKRCGDVAKNGVFVGKVRAEGVSCKSARRVARRWMRSGQSQNPVRVGHWACRSKRRGYEGSRIRCVNRRDRSKVVRFVVAA